jgi:hypothetical protein
MTTQDSVLLGRQNSTPIVVALLDRKRLMPDVSRRAGATSQPDDRRSETDGGAKRDEELPAAGHTPLYSCNDTACDFAWTTPENHARCFRCTAELIRLRPSASAFALGFGGTSRRDHAGVAGMRFARIRGMSGHNRKKRDGHRTEKAARARKRDFEQPILAAEAKQRGQDVSNFTDGQIAGPDWKRKERQERG